MAFPASTQRLSQALDGVSGAALRIKQQTQQLRTLSAAGPLTAARISHWRSSYTQLSRHGLPPQRHGGVHRNA